MQRTRRAALLVGLGLVIVLGTLVVGALTAPSLATVTDGNESTLVGSQSTSGSWNEAGAVFELQGADVTWRINPANNVFDVTQLENGSVMYAFETGGYETGCEPYDPPCHKTGYRVVDPNGSGDAELLSEYTFPIRYATNSEVHAADHVSGDEFVVADMEHERVFTVEHGEITWQWNASERYTPPDDPTRNDWLHINDVDAINGTHFLVSVRNANQLLVLERGEGVVEVINQDTDDSNDARCKEKLFSGENDDVRCGDPNVLNRQHNPQWLGEGAVLVADSHGHRAVELHRNETTGQWEETWAVGKAAGVGFTWPRDADRLPNGNTLITDTHNVRVVEVAPNGSTVWSVNTFDIPYEADRLPHGEPVGAPTIENGTVAEQNDDEIPLFTEAALGARGEFDFVPVWFRGPHLLGIAAGVLIVLVGGLYGGYGYWRERGD